MNASLVMLLVSTTLLPAAALAQAPAPVPGGELRIEARPRRVVVRPDMPASVVEQDAGEARAEMDRQRRQRDIVRDVTRPSSRRPDLDYDVKSGIQSRQLRDALRR